jgi:threonine dehydrogenase-like Zn-dependent dehydrogenase
LKAIAIIPGQSTVHLVDRPEPAISQPDQVRLQIIRVGICGTDREEVAGGRADPPFGQPELVIGHEMLGKVVEVGASVSRVKPGDLAIFTVRRGCGRCLPCSMNRSDMCETGDYRERGIKGLDGYQTEFVVDCEQFVIRVPTQLEPIAVLTEPLSIAEKALDEAVRIQFARLPDAQATPNWLYGRRCLVAGLGPVGLLAAIALRLRGADVYGMDIVDAATTRPQWLSAIGGKYIDGRSVPAEKVTSAIGPMDLIVEGTGVAALEFNLLDALAIDGIYVVTGIPGGDRPLKIPGAQLIRQLVLNNQVMLGSVNASRDHYQMAIDDLAQAQSTWGDHIQGLITGRHPYTDFETPLRQHTSDEIKTVIEWAKP